MLCAFYSLQFQIASSSSYGARHSKMSCGAHIRESDSGLCHVYLEGATAGRAAYIRYVVPTPDDEEATVEYDLDEEDEEWLQRHNHKVPQLLHTCHFQILLNGVQSYHSMMKQVAAALVLWNISCLPRPAPPPPPLLLSSLLHMQGLGAHSL